MGFVSNVTTLPLKIYQIQKRSGRSYRRSDTSRNQQRGKRRDLAEVLGVRSVPGVNAHGPTKPHHIPFQISQNECQYMKEFDRGEKDRKAKENEGGPVEGHHAGASIDSVESRREVRIADDRLWVRFDHTVIQLDHRKYHEQAGKGKRDKKKRRRKVDLVKEASVAPSAATGNNGLDALVSEKSHNISSTIII